MAHIWSVCVSEWARLWSVWRPNRAQLRSFCLVQHPHISYILPLLFETHLYVVLYVNQTRCDECKISATLRDTSQKLRALCWGFWTFSERKKLLQMDSKLSMPLCIVFQCSVVSMRCTQALNAEIWSLSLDCHARAKIVTATNFSHWIPKTSFLLFSHTTYQ